MAAGRGPTLETGEATLRRPARWDLTGHDRRRRWVVAPWAVAVAPLRVPVVEAMLAPTLSVGTLPGGQGLTRAVRLESTDPGQDRGDPVPAGTVAVGAVRVAVLAVRLVAVRLVAVRPVLVWTVPVRLVAAPTTGVPAVVALAAGSALTG